VHPTRPPPVSAPAIAQVQGSGRGRRLSATVDTAVDRVRRSASRPDERTILALVCGITLSGLLVRLPSFGDSLFGDELSTYYIVSGSTLGHVVYLLEGGRSVDLNPPLYFIFAWLAERLGDSSELLRLPSLVAGTAAIPLTYLLGARTVGRPAAIVGTGLIALSPFAIFFSAEARSFALVMTLALLSTLALLRAIETRSLEWWAAYAAFSSATIYTNYTAVFLLGGQFLWAIVTQPTLRRSLLVANVAAAVVYAPWLPSLIEDSASPGIKVPEQISPFGLGSLRIDLGRWSIGHPFAGLKTVPGDAAVILIVAGVSIAVIGVGWRMLAAARVGRRLRPSRGLALVLVLALSTPVGAALYSWLGPGLVLAGGALLTSSGGRVRYLASGMVVAAFAIASAKVLEADVQRPDSAAAAEFIERARAPGEPVLDFPLVTPGPLTALEIALTSEGMPPSRQYPILRLGLPSRHAMLHGAPYAQLTTPALESVVRRADGMARGRNLFLVIGEAGPGTSRFVTDLVRRPGIHPTLVTRRIFPGFVPLSVYEYALPAPS
jgi:hypothetical protein